MPLEALFEGGLDSIAGMPANAEGALREQVRRILLSVKSAQCKFVIEEDLEALLSGIGDAFTPSVILYRRLQAIASAIVKARVRAVIESPPFWLLPCLLNIPAVKNFIVFKA